MMPRVAYDLSQLADGWHDLGLRPGDQVLVHSSYKAFGPVTGGPATVIESLIAAVTQGWPSKGTVLFPTFNFDFCQGKAFDHLLTPSQMGVLSETARLQSRFRRTQHPIYSFAIYGKDAEWLASRHYESAYGATSVFAWLHFLDAWIVMVGLPWNNSFTFVHHVEEMEGCDYRYMKPFYGEVVGRGPGLFSMFVRDLDKGTETQVNPFGAWAEATHLARVTQIGDAKVVAIRARTAYDAIRDILRAGTARGRLYEVAQRP